MKHDKYQQKQSILAINSKRTALPSTLLGENTLKNVSIFLGNTPAKQFRVNGHLFPGAGWCLLVISYLGLTTTGL